MRYDPVQKRYIIDGENQVPIEDLGPAREISQDEHFAQQHEARETLNAAADAARVGADTLNAGDQSYPTEVIVANHGNPVWDAIWQTIKGWDIRRQGSEGLYSEATGDDVQRIFDAIRAADPRFTNQETP